ncbi:serine hydrolase [Nocardia sp. NBC_01009]|uniref:serine hydrolase n=1 Tax=Nocardia sp. NBC_01009 TaxID=2975996 RepID=UPI003870C0A1
MSANRTGRTRRGQLGADSHFRIGSVTKTFAAIVVLHPANDGRAQRDGSIAEKLPRVVFGGEPSQLPHRTEARNSQMTVQAAAATMSSTRAARRGNPSMDAPSSRRGPYSSARGGRPVR